ncbi:MAG: hypothetical protein CVV27_18970, partial [Candidatus Melainabacteria bacterium HGW-Melainabacteria-1]
MHPHPFGTLIAGLLLSFAAMAGPTTRAKSLPKAPSPAISCCTPEQARDDLAQLFETLEAIHPQLYHHRSRESLQQALADLEPSALSTPLALWRAAAPLVNSLGDGHTWLNLGETEFSTLLADGVSLFPLALRITPDRRVWVDADPFGRGVPVGAELHAIDGQLMPELLARLEAFEPGEREAFRLANLANRFSVQLKLAIGAGPDYGLNWSWQGQVSEQRIAGVALG